MRIVHAASEMFPFIKTGGLADVVGALTGSLAEMGNEVTVFLPGYRAVLESETLSDAGDFQPLAIEMGDQIFQGEVRTKELSKNLTLHLICRDEFFDRSQTYGTPTRDYEDNAERFLFFSKAVVDVLGKSRSKFDVVHSHDWQAALIPLLLRMEELRRRRLLAEKTFLTIHNLAFQGIFPMRVFDLTGFPDEFRGIDGLEFYGNINFLKGGILFSDRVGTVSPTYGREILTPEFGCGLEGVLHSRKEKLFCQLNGIDSEIWNPEIDRLLPANYSVEDLSGKWICRKELLKQVKLKPKEKGPVFGMICRFTEQKGLELFRGAIDRLLERDCRLVILGSGSPVYEEWLRGLQEKFPEKMSVHSGMNEKLSHLIEAGSDFFLMPSIFEPCGLNQMYSMRYGTLPLVSRVGGLADTVIDLDEKPDEGTGISFPPTVAGLKDGLDRAFEVYSDKKRMKAAIERAMKQDFSWKKAAKGYQRLYERPLSFPSK